MAKDPDAEAEGHTAGEDGDQEDETELPEQGGGR